MPDYTGDLRGASFRRADLTGARFRMVDLSGAVLRDISLAGASIDGAELGGLRIDGVDVAPLIEAELTRRDPVRGMLRPSDPDGLRATWAALQESWAGTLARASALPPAALDVSVQDEWSFLQTLRHLVFATDAWLGAARGDSRPHHPWGVAFSELDEFVPGGAATLGIDPTAAPTFAEVLELRRDRVAAVSTFLADLRAERLADEVTGPPWESDPVTVLTCLRVILNEEYLHRRFAERDLAAVSPSQEG